MKKFLLPFLAVAMSLLSLPAFSQKDNNKDTTALLNLPGDNLDLYAVLTLFQKSKTIEAFEKSLNDEKEGINNLDLNLDKKVDFIKVVTTKKDSSYTFVLQVDVTKTETQDVAVILLNKVNGKVSLQMVGDPELYGKDYVIEPKGNSSITANPGYVGADPVTVDVPATTTVVVQSAPIVQYVYSPAYGGHYGGGNTVIINNGNRNQINHYNNNSRNRSNTVSDNMARGNYGNGNRGSNGVNNNMANGNRGSGNGVNNNMANNNRGSGNGVSNNKASTSNRASTSNMSNNRSSSSNFSSSQRSSSNRSSGGSFGGGGGRGGGGGGGRRR